MGHVPRGDPATQTRKVQYIGNFIASLMMIAKKLFDVYAIVLTREVFLVYLTEFNICVRLRLEQSLIAKCNTNWLP